VEFGRPIALVHFLWLIPAAVIFFSLAWIRREKILSRFGELGLLHRLEVGTGKRTYLLSAFLILSAAACLIFAAAAPLYGSRLKTIRRMGVNIVIALDVSSSMLAEDIKPNRLEKAKRELHSLLDGLEGDRVGVIAFAGSSFLQCPLTLDYDAVKMLMGLVGPGSVSLPGTNMADAIHRGIKVLKGVGRAYRVLILITDGEDHSGKLQEAIEAAREANVRVFTVGIGSRDGVPIPVVDEEGAPKGHKRDEEGHVVLSRLQEESLQRVALETGGLYFRSTAGKIEVRKLLERISEMEKEELDSREVSHKEERFQIPLALAALLLLLEIHVSRPMRRRR